MDRPPGASSTCWHTFKLPSLRPRRALAASRRRASRRFCAWCEAARSVPLEGNLEHPPLQRQREPLAREADNVGALAQQTPAERRLHLDFNPALEDGGVDHLTEVRRVVRRDPAQTRGGPKWLERERPEP